MAAGRLDKETVPILLNNKIIVAFVAVAVAVA